LPRLFSDLKVLHYREQEPDSDGRAEAMLVARAKQGA